METNKDWSLEGKGIWKDHFYKQEEHWYPVSDINILRLKLIEDIINRFKYECETCGQGVIMDDEVKQIINKRFGVK